MAVNVSFNGNTYSVPSRSGESGWASLTDYLVAIANNAATQGALKQAIRVATTSPVTVASTDCTVVTDLSVAGPVAVTLPAGVSKQVVIILDGKGDAGSNNVTISGTGGQLINGAASYVLNVNRGGVVLQFDGTQWRVLAAFYGTDPSFSSVTVSTLTVSGSATVGGAAVTTASNTQTLTGKTIDADQNTITNIENADIKAGAAIALSKLANGTELSVVGRAANSSGSYADIAASSDGQVLRRDGTALAFDFLTNSNISTSASISRSKLANGVAGAVVINDPSTGAMSSENELSTSRGGTGISSTATFPTSGVVVTRTSTDTLTNKTLTAPTQSSFEDWTHVPTPANPGAGILRVYVKSDGKVYTLTSAGVETALLRAGNAGGGDVVGPASSMSGNVASFNGTTGKVLQDSGKAAADLVTGPASSVDSELALFNSTTGKVVKRASGTGYVKVSSGVMQTPSATVPGTDMEAASASNAGAVTTGTQTFAGAKTFNSPPSYLTNPLAFATEVALSGSGGSASVSTGVPSDAGAFFIVSGAGTSGGFAGLLVAYAQGANPANLRFHSSSTNCTITGSQSGGIIFVTVANGSGAISASVKCFRT